MTEPLEFKARKEMIFGKETLVVKPIAEVTKHADGSQDVTMHMPSLGIIAAAKKQHGIE